MPKVKVDEALCTGCGLCIASCPEVFELGSDNIAYVKNTKACDCDLEQIASECPVTAISIE